MGFKEKYPDLIKYHENKENLGVDKNLIKIMEMSEGDFIWLLGDDDMIINYGIKEVINFIDNHCDKNTGLIMLSHKSYFVDSKTGKEVVLFDTAEKDKPQYYQINLKNMIGIRFNNSFLSVLLLNNHFIKKILEEEKDTIKEATGNYYVHTFLYQLMLLKYPQLEVMKFNKTIIKEELHYYKLYIEDEFKVFYAGRKTLNDLLLHSKYISDDYKKTIIKEQKELKKSIIKEMGILKAFGSFNYLSFFGCVTLFFQKATLLDALLFSSFFGIFFIVPSFILRGCYKAFIKIKHKKNWQKMWLNMAVKYTGASGGSRRFIA